VPGNSFDSRYIPGGSSSGSAVAVAKGLVSFSLGTDTAGSGRVPAAFNNIIGLKPSRGLLSTRGVVPACRSLDCISIFALSADDAALVLDTTAAFDEQDEFSRPRPNGSQAFPIDATGCFQFGVPRSDQQEFFGDSSAPELFGSAIDRLELLGGTSVEIDFEPFFEVARLLYEGPWVEERRAAVGSFIVAHPNDTDPVVRRIIAEARKKSAVEAFEAYYRLKKLRRHISRLWKSIELLAVPTAPTIYTIEEIKHDPVELNKNLGYYTNFLNLLDMTGISVPIGFLSSGLPFGVTLSAPAFSEDRVLQVGDALHRSYDPTMGATGSALPAKSSGSNLGSLHSDQDAQIAVVGAHLSGLPLNHELTDKGGTLLRKTRTAACYRLYALPETVPPKPGLVRTEDGEQIELEIWRLDHKAFGRFVSQVPPPLSIGTIELEDGVEVHGFLCEAYALKNADDISRFGGWRAYLRQNAVA
jgi:allophanate hydrolase